MQTGALWFMMRPSETFVSKPHEKMLIGACRGYTPKSTLNAIYSMRAAGAHVVADASALPQILAGNPFGARRTA